VTRVVATLDASGVHIYVCRHDIVNQPAWTSKAPQANLYDAFGQFVLSRGARPLREMPEATGSTKAVAARCQSRRRRSDLHAASLGHRYAQSGKPEQARYVQRLAAQASVHVYCEAASR
jgi:hypothetical protein